MRITTSGLSRAAALSAVLSGLLYIAIQFVHPDETLAVVDTNGWAIVALLTVAMAVFGLIGITGIYLRQVEQTGILGLVGYVAFGVFFLLVVPFSFTEALILPLVSDQAPGFVQNFLGLFNGDGTDGTLGAMESIPSVAGGLYLLGGAMLGLAIFRARILSSWAAILLIVGAVIAPLTGLVPHQVGRFAALPVGLAFIGLGLSLWSERADAASSESSAIPSASSPQTAV